MCSTVFQEVLSVTRQRRRRFGSPPTTRGGEDHRTPVGPRTRWASSRCYTRRIGWDSPNHPGSGKWTSTPPAPIFCVIGPALRTNTAKTNRLYPRMRIGAVQRELSRNNGERFLAPGYACVPRSSGSAATTIRCSPREPTFDTRMTMGCGGLEKSARVRRKRELDRSRVVPNQTRYIPSSVVLALIFPSHHNPSSPLY